MAFDINRILDEHRGRQSELHRAHVNPQLARVLKTIGFDRDYDRAQGQYLWDEAGTKYLDMLGGYAVFNMGRNHPVIRKAMVDFLEREYPTLVQMEAPLLSGILAGELKRRVPYDLERVYFTSTGAEGVETAIKCARCATGRPVIVYCRNAFHGLTSGALSINGGEFFRGGFEPLSEHVRPVPFNDLAALEAALAPGDVAAFIVEPVQGKGVFIAEPGYLAEAGVLCRRHGALLVADEVQSGVGRTGRFLAIEHDADAEPDMVVLSKALSGGYVPVGAVLMRRHIHDAVFSSMERAVVHSSTFGQGSLAMVVALASLHVLDEEGLMANATVRGDQLANGMRAMTERFEFLKDIRHRGLMVGIELGKPRSLKLRTAWTMTRTLDRNLLPQAVTIPLLDDHHILTQVAGHNIDVIKLIPPLVISDEDVTWFLSAFEQVMERLHRFPGPAWEVMRKIGKNTMFPGARAGHDVVSP